MTPESSAALWRKAAVVLASLVLASACASSDGRTELESVGVPDVGPGQIARVAGPENPATLGQCEEAVVAVAAAPGFEPLITVDQCQVCCGWEPAGDLPEEKRGRRFDQIGKEGTSSRSTPALETETENVAVTSIGRDGTAYALAGNSVVRDDGAGWQVIAKVEDVRPEATGVLAFSDVASGIDGTVYAAAGSGVARIDPGPPRWVIPPRPQSPSDPGALKDGAVVPPNENEPIVDLSIMPDGAIVVVTSQQVRTVSPTGESRTLLDSSTGAVTKDAEIFPVSLNEVDGVTICCSGTTFAASAVSPESGMLYLLDAEMGRVLRLRNDGLVEHIAGPRPTQDACRGECAEEHPVGGGRDLGHVEDGIALVPQTVTAHASLMALSSDGSLLVALGSAGLIEIGGVDGLPGR